MKSVKNIEIAEYDYPLPDERIAKYPLAKRDSSKLLIYNKGVVDEDVFGNLPKHIPSGSLMIFNNTKVILSKRSHKRKYKYIRKNGQRNRIYRRARADTKKEIHQRCKTFNVSPRFPYISF